jgi:tetratricopeptide (TPR) repeat protein
MKTLAITTCCSLIVAFNSGCNGPTKAGQEARADANDRVSLMNAQINFEQARQAFSTGEFEKAAREIRIAISRTPDQAPYYALEGRIFMETHRLEKALESFNIAIAKDPKLAEAYYFRGIVFERWSDNQRAFESYEAAFENDNSNVQYLLASAETLVALEQFDAAKSKLESHLTYFEHHAAMYELLGRIAMIRGEFEEASKRLTNAAMLLPEDTAIHQCLANAQFEAGAHTQCLKTIAELQRRSTEPNTDLIRMRARCLDKIGRLDEARNLYADLTSRDPSDLQSWIELASVAHTLGDFRRVGYCGSRIVALSPESYQGYMFNGLAAQHGGNLPQAIAQFRNAAARAPENAAPHILLGLSLQRSGNAHGALTCYAAALRAEPDNTDAKDLMAQVNDSE